MNTYMTPFTHLVNLQDGTIPAAPLVQQRRLSDMRGLYADPAAEYALMAANPLIYEVYEATQNPKEAGQLLYSTTIIRPGKVGDEYFMTKGHYHAKGECAELYYGLLGEGYLLLQAGSLIGQTLHGAKRIYNIADIAKVRWKGLRQPCAA